VAPAWRDPQRRSLITFFLIAASAIPVFYLRETVHESLWPRLEKYVRCGFWGLNIGLEMMILFSLLPSGVLQVHDVLENGIGMREALTISAVCLRAFWNG
jgi:nitric oxide reductase large subunit